ncbi:TPA: SocA family protein [Stenotrophomonas maltophilia]|nr:SocA family protein [Stenotrophomonas maltophilia]HDS1161272.1 SocA family protein [Stenotrophomonas maltophilia]
MKKHPKQLALYDEKKATEVAVFFLLRACEWRKHISKLRLVKWMYLAERYCYKHFGEPLIGDRMVSMKHGPVLSNTLYLMERPRKARIRTGVWEANVLTVRHSQSHRPYMELPENSAYRSTDDLRSLSDAEIDVLEEVWDKYSRCSANELETRLHDPAEFPEWKWSEVSGNAPIRVSELLPILGWNQEDTAVAVARLERLKGIEKAFDSVQG